MRDGGRISAAIETLSTMEARSQPAHLALKAWGEGARYAGAKDRAFVSGLVLDILRRRRSMAWMMDADSDRARALGVLHFIWGWPLDRIAAAAGEEHGPGALDESELSRLAAPNPLAAAPPPVRGDYPDWLDDAFARSFGEARALEGEGLASRAPVDLRVNTLKSDVGRVMKALAKFGPEPLAFPPSALRIPAPAAAERAAPVEATPEFERGLFEVQDAGSQVAAAAAGEIRKRQVLDYCAGGGGKTLALAAAMANTGQLYAYDADARRLAHTVGRAQRAGVRNLQVRSPLAEHPLEGLSERMDLVFVDAPCTGSGTWRRHPDAKWRLTAAQLDRRIREQDAVLAAAAEYVKPGGALIYATCSLLMEENEDRVSDFLGRRRDFVIEPVELAGAEPWRTAEGFLRLTPRTAAADGFFVARLGRAQAA